MRIDLCISGLVAAAAFSGPIYADETPLATIQQGLRAYASFSETSNDVIHWKDPIVLQILAGDSGSFDAFVASHIYTTVFQYSYYAGNEINLPVNGSGFVELGKEVLPSANFFVGLFQAADDRRKDDVVTFEEIDPSKNHILSNVIEKNLTELFPGCSGGWGVSMQNVIVGYALLIDQDLSRSEQINCADFALPYAFGVETGELFLELGVEGTEKEAPEISDRSSIGLRIKTAAACREFFGDVGVECAQEMLDRFYKVYGRVGGLQEP